MGLGVQSHRSHNDSQLAILTPGITRIEDAPQHHFRSGSYHQPLIDRHDYQSGHFKEVEEGIHSMPMTAGENHQNMGQYQQPHETGEKPRGRERSREGMGEGNGAAGLGGGALTSNTEPQTRKRRRSRKGLDKKFECPQQGCGRVYSRAEHLYRHQLNRKAPFFFILLKK